MTATFISPNAFLQHWLGHRRVTRRMIEAFPEDQIFTFSVGGMRPFGVLVREFLGMAAPTVRGVISGSWDNTPAPEATTRGELLEQWDQTTVELERIWPTIPASRFAETITAFGQWTLPVHDLILYVVDNEIHHRGQAYVYMRALGVEPPSFPDRS